MPVPFTAETKPRGTCYLDAWRFVVKEQEGYLIHGTVLSDGKRVNHAWVETETGYVWEPETKQFYTKETFQKIAEPIEEARYDWEQAAIMVTRTENMGPWTDDERRQFLPATSPPDEPSSDQEIRSKIIDCFYINKLEYFNQANIDKVWKCTGIPKQQFVDIIWEMAQTDFIFDILSGRQAPHSITAPKRGPLRWNKDQVEIANLIREKVPEKQKIWFGYPRYLYLREKHRRGKDMKPATSSTAADYWNTYLEHNAIRAPAHGRGPDTDAGAFLAWHLEAAGDIIRELSKEQYADPNYIFQKYNRLKDHLTDRDWSDPLSDREYRDLVKVREDIEGLPADTELLRIIKVILIAIADRRPREIEANLGSLSDRLKFHFSQEKSADTLYPKPEPTVISKYPAASLTITHGGSTVTGRFQKKGEMEPGQVEPDIVFEVLKRGSDEDTAAAKDELVEALRANIRQVEDSESLEDVEPTIRVKVPAERAKYPLILSMEEFRKDWEPNGWNLIFIGPTSTWRQDWGEWEAIRDIVQNCLDESEAYKWGFDNDGLWISDKGKGVAIADFLLGPPKLKAEYARGRFGEGMKIASLALIRNGYNVHIKTVGREIWIVFVEQEIDGKVQSLAALWKPDGTARGTDFHILGYFGSAYEDRFAVNLPKSSIIVQAPAIITEPVQRYNQLIQHEFTDGNRIYTRDIYMRPINSLYSYNLWGFEMAPDRFAPVSEHHVWIDVGRLWSCVKDVKLLEIFFQMKAEEPMIETEETHNLTMFDHQMGINPETNDFYAADIKKNGEAWLQAWKNTFGEDAVIRTDHHLDAVVKHLGYKSVGLTYGIATVLERVIPYDSQIIEKSQERLREVQVVPDSEISETQYAHLALAREIAGRVYMEEPPSAVHAAIIPPASDRVRTAGMYGKTLKDIYIHVDQLQRGRSTVDTVIHEIAHHTSKAEDGDEKHNLEMTRVAGDVVYLVASRALDDLISAPGFKW